jgi:hypothetical protein
MVAGSYTISASATWEKKTVVLPADTTGALDNDNASSLSCVFMLGAGSNFTSGSLQTTWGASNFSNGTTAAGQTNLAAATNNYWQVTGVQLEAGAVATPFEFEDFGITLTKCQRYYQRVESKGNAYAAFGTGFAIDANQLGYVVTFPTTMRTNPSSYESSAAGTFYADVPAGAGVATAVNLIGRGSLNAIQFVIARTGCTTGQGTMLLSDNTDSAYIAMNAEL